ncbi:high frequency lysogenization protein HflD [Burkholderia glumae]|uniref:nickel/cobalt transporter n=1 Tax=Burkholderia glumae TaxID=337 RepID=UPI000F5D6C86|nr:high frequency lysogenization protein HflD [Burkholderia glumae]MCQ0034019.1 high frequency lysogenization protein HflD [Burkholderia glumae]MCQ0039902.1 high frequency lysogenization protein HflD [Burkholderia glumae]QJW80717.1 high frequency lysogenization protein HflD [Burkholderia glumae]RQZ66763.1 high frequency lysogenization protein HflD [Burkholderia glumae]UVS84053.1 high frequency lysogenization protein HflD [Burkholderia glumae]
MLNFSRPALAFFLACCVAFAGIGCATPSCAAAPTVDVFGQPIRPASSASATPAAPPAPEPEARHALVLPEFARTVLVTTLIWQGRLNAHIADVAAQLRRDASPWSWLTLLAVSFAYGMLHAIGPGHGKLVAGAYLGSRRTRVAQAIGLASWGAAVQAMSAIVLVFGAAWFAREGMSNVLSNAASLDVVSYLLLCMAGLFMLYNTLTRRDCCVEPGAARLVPDARDIGRESDGNTPAYLGAKLRVHARSSRRAMVANPSTWTVTLQILATGFASGVRPCVGSIFVLIASVTARAPWIGIAAAFAIAAGVAVTVTLFGLGAIGANRFVMGRGIRLRARLQTAQRVVGIAGAAAIVLFGAVQAALISMGYAPPGLS